MRDETVAREILPIPNDSVVPAFSTFQFVILLRVLLS
jgi:hypothetical protein